MRKIGISILTLFVAICLCACGKDSSADKNNVTDNGSSSEKNSYGDENQTGTAKQSDGSQNKDFVYSEIKTGNIINKDFVELQFTRSIITQFASKDTVGVDLPAKDGNIYFVICGNIKNTSPEKIDIRTGLNITLVLDEKYKYEDGKYSFDKDSSVVPLSAENFVIYYELPDGVLSSCENYAYQISFNENMTYILDKDSAAYHYVIHGKTSEYGSAATVVDIRSLGEYVKKMMEDNGYGGTLLRTEKAVQINDLKSYYFRITSDLTKSYEAYDSASKKMKTKTTNFEYKVYPELAFSKGIGINGFYGHLGMIVCAEDNYDYPATFPYITSDIVFTSGTDKISLANDGTWLSINSKNSNGFLDYGYTINLFEGRSEKLRKILNSSGVTIEFHVQMYDESKSLINQEGKDTVFCYYKPDDKVKDYLLMLLDIYDETAKSVDLVQ